MITANYDVCIMKMIILWMVASTMAGLDPSQC